MEVTCLNLGEEGGGGNVLINYDLMNKKKNVTLPIRRGHVLIEGDVR